MLGLIIAALVLGSIIGYVAALKSQRRVVNHSRLFKLNFWELNKRYLYHVASAKKYDEEIKRILSCAPTKSDGGVGNYQQAIKQRKPHIATRKVDIDELREWTKEAKTKEFERKK